MLEAQLDDEMLLHQLSLCPEISALVRLLCMQEKREEAHTEREEEEEEEA
eukprot:COSAG06_NODE_22429_length_717_cov_3.160256_1_plen_49_part_10